MIFEEFYDFKTIAHAFLNTKKLAISSATQLRLTASEFGKVQVAKGFGDLGGWSEGINILKDGVTVADFQNVILPQNHTRFGLPEKKKADIRKMMPYLEPEVKAYFQEMLMETPPVENAVADEGE